MMNSFFLDSEPIERKKRKEEIREVMSTFILI